MNTSSMHINITFPGRLIIPFVVAAALTIAFTQSAQAGCGSGWNDIVIADNPLGIPFNGACEIHDKCYDTCGSVQAACDWEFRDNMNKACATIWKLARKYKQRAQAHAKMVLTDFWSARLHATEAAKATAYVVILSVRGVACPTLAKNYANAVHLLGGGPFCTAQKAKSCCPVVKSCRSTYTCAPPPLAKDIESKPKPKKVSERILVDGGKWCDYWVWLGGPEQLPPFDPDGTPPPFDPDGTPPPFDPDGTPPPFDPDGTPPPFDPDGTPPPFNPDGTPPPFDPDKDQPKTGKPENEHPPEIFVKAKKSVMENGKRVSRPVAGAQIKFSFLAPPLPGSGGHDDTGFDQDPIQATTGADGTVTLGANNNGHSRIESPVRQIGLLQKLRQTVIPDATAAVKRQPMPAVHLEVRIDPIDSYLVKIHVNRKKKNWRKPSTYLGKKLAKNVFRTWVVENVMYVVVNFPEEQGVSK